MEKKTAEEILSDVFKRNTKEIPHSDVLFDMVLAAMKEYVAQSRSQPSEQEQEIERLKADLSDSIEAVYQVKELEARMDKMVSGENYTKVTTALQEEIERLKAANEDWKLQDRLLKKRIAELEARMDKMVSGDNYTKVTTALQEEIERLKASLKSEVEVNRVLRNCSEKDGQRITELEAQLNYVKTWIKSNNEGHNVSFDFSKIESLSIEQERGDDELEQRHQIELSNYAYQIDLAKRERDKAEQEIERLKEREASWQKGIEQLFDRNAELEAQLKEAFEAGRNYQRGEHSEYHGGAEHDYPNFNEWKKKALESSQPELK